MTASGVGADVSAPPAVAAAVERIASELGPPVALVNNAGVLRDNLVFKMTDEDWDTVMAVHSGAVDRARSVAPHFPGVPVWAIDADGIVVRPGPRLIDGVEAIAAILHPDAVPSAAPHQVQRVALPG